MRCDEIDRDCELTMPPATHGLSPLSDKEIEELEAFLMEDRDGAEAMMFDTMDGYMHAVAIGPTTPKPQQWLPPIWEHTQAQGMVPAAQSSRRRLRTPRWQDPTRPRLHR